MTKVPHIRVVFDSSALVTACQSQTGSKRLWFAICHFRSKFIPHAVITAQIATEIHRNLGEVAGQRLLDQLMLVTRGSYDAATSTPEFIGAMRECNHAACNLPYGSLGVADEAIIEAAIRHDALLVTNDAAMTLRAKHRGVKVVFTTEQYTAHAA